MAFFRSEYGEAGPNGERIQGMAYNIDAIVQQVSSLTGASMERVASALERNQSFSLFQDGLIRAVREDIEKENSAGR
ncbi:hypothetical protein [Pseudoflavonifractor phocaeensis]|uniref:hypothetical protein n=1 Tax=Pseudoflavonifractor phocaeensis TaxID=1870988 RepID=UPI001956F393|nr:hypothetical protein [Pseudoflavonifractor phocaeensis]MBM6887633.1 hypothetical protein [Pseudoflavonifractor phocaeensis]